MTCIARLPPAAAGRRWATKIIWHEAIAFYAEVLGEARAEAHSEARSEAHAEVLGEACAEPRRKARSEDHAEVLSEARAGVLGEAICFRYIVHEFLVDLAGTDQCGSCRAVSLTGIVEGSCGSL